MNGGATQAATSGQTLVSNVTGNRTSSLRGASSGDVLQNTGIWAQALYSDANQDLRDGVAGFNAYSRGIAIGADGQLTDQLTLGVAYSFLHTSVNSDSGNTTDVDGNALTLYSGFEQGNYFVDANLSYGINDNENKRRIAGTTAKGDYDSQVLGANVVGGYTYHLNEQFLVEPRLAARYARVDIDGYHEKGSSAALKVDSQRYEVAEFGAGVRLAGDFPVGNGSLQPQAKLMAYHDFAADEAQSTSTFVLGGTPFVSQGAKAVRNSYEAGIGADYHLGAVTVGVSYDYTGKTDFNADTFTAKIRYDF
ncbi:Outer membrane autotransporter barrel [Pseudomonas aeruginosa]|uniref:autotransporter outer membrane beta-barrel domain-containing protein n=1 Tax=Pseudomonas aeruginosa TaxID=287 RepID=UPI000D900234|nr:autotransporter outer membrane beta-barrel domain-containing protein [Pseudomonas aeruginosa]SPY50742.1 Outer membrane autotransporter barrel [Pseudomonas aeruginosa]